VARITQLLIGTGLRGASIPAPRSLPAGTTARTVTVGGAIIAVHRHPNYPGQWARTCNGEGCTTPHSSPHHAQEDARREGHGHAADCRWLPRQAPTGRHIHTRTAQDS
jgi:hypothetical protein